MFLLSSWKVYLSMNKLSIVTLSAMNLKIVWCKGFPTFPLSFLVSSSQIQTSQLSDRQDNLCDPLQENVWEEEN